MCPNKFSLSRRQAGGQYQACATAFPLGTLKKAMFPNLLLNRLNMMFFSECTSRGYNEFGPLSFCFGNLKIHSGGI